MLIICSQRMFAMKRLPDQRLAKKYSHSLFQAIIVTRILYILPAWGCFLSKNVRGELMPISGTVTVINFHHFV